MDRTPDPEPEPDDAALTQAVFDAQRGDEAVLLRVVMDLDAEAAGRVLGKRAGAVRAAAFRGLRRLGRELGTPAAEISSRRPVTRTPKPTLGDLR
jgi:RNA polymerase sigma-70 factor (ECF subfamily)